MPKLLDNMSSTSLGVCNFYVFSSTWSWYNPICLYCWNKPTTIKNQWNSKLNLKHNAKWVSWHSASKDEKDQLKTHVTNGYHGWVKLQCSFYNDILSQFTMTNITDSHTELISLFPQSSKREQQLYQNMKQSVLEGLCCWLLLH